MIRAATSAGRIALAVAVFGSVLSASAASAGAATTPRAALHEAQRQVQALSPQASAALAKATVPGLWINARTADAPPYGLGVFTGSGQAVGDLAGLSGSGARTASALIVAADRSLAEDAIAQARGGGAALLTRAKHALSVGEGLARGGKLSSAVDAYAEAWQAAYGALTHRVASEVTRVPSGALAAAAEQALSSPRFDMAGPMFEQPSRPLSTAGKPEVFYAGSEACPFCGVQRWGMIVALSQFGTFSNLHLMQSIFNNDPQVTTFTFFGSSYRSPYISFVPVEVWSNVPNSPGLTPLQKLTHGESALLHRFDPPIETPFIDVANQFVIDSATVNPHLIAHKSWTQLAGALTDPSNISTQAIAGEAEVLTAEVCAATGGNPQSVCSSAVVQQYETALPTLTGRGGSCPAPPPPGGSARDAAVSARARTGQASPIATAARCQG